MSAESRGNDGLTDEERDSDTVRSWATLGTSESGGLSREEGRALLRAFAPEPRPLEDKP